MHLGIISCEILRQEIYDVVRWTGIKRVFMVLPETGNPVILVAVKKMNERFLAVFTDDSIVIEEKPFAGIKRAITEGGIQDSVIITLGELRLHDRPWTLRANIEAWIKRLSPVVDLVLLGYGLCGSTAADMEELIRRADVPVVIPRYRGEILNNCIEIALGKDRVQELLREETGTFFMTPAGAYIIGEPQVILDTIDIAAGGGMKRSTIDTPGIIKLLKNHYKRVIKICYTEADERDEYFDRVVKNFASKFGLKIETIRGSSRLMIDTLRGLKTTKS